MPKSDPIASDLALLKPFWATGPERSVLPNGLTVITQEDRSAPLVSVQVWVKTGSIHEGDLLGAGLSHYLEHLLFKGTATRPGRDISARVQAHGGYINAYTTFDRTVYYIDLPSEHVEVAVELLADMVLRSTLPADEVAREKDVILREIAMGRDDPDQRLSESLFDTAFKTHPYRYPIIGYKDVFASVGREELLAYYQGRYVPNNLVVVVVGAVTATAAQDLVVKHFGSAPRGRLAPVLVPDEGVPLAPRSLHRFEDVELTRAGLAWQIPGLSHTDAPALDLLATMLGHGDSSVLWTAIREKARLVHSIDAHCWNPGSVGLFYVSFTCEAGKREAATKAVERELARVVAKGFSPAQLRRAVRQLVVGEINTRKTMSGQASRLGSAEVTVGDLGFSRSWFERIGTITSTGLRRVAKTYLVAERRTSVSLNPTASRPTASVDGPAGAATSSAVSEVRLSNGARLLLQPDRHLPNLHLRLLFQGGPLYEPADKRGATALLATMLTKDTKTRSSAEVARLIEDVGGSFYPFSGNNSFGLAAEVLPGDVDRALELLSDALLRPAFLADTLEMEKEAQVAELQQDADDVVTLGRKLLRKKFFGAYPLGIDAAGEIEMVQALRSADLRALWKQLVVAGNVVLAVAGDFDPKTLRPALEKLLKALPKGALAPRAAVFTEPASVGDFIEIQPREQAVVYQAFPSPGLLAPDFYVGEVADELFSGMSSRLFERVREEKGLAYFVRSSRVTGVDTGLFAFYAGTTPARYAEVLTEIDAEIARVQAGEVTADELARCQTRLKAARRMGLQSNSARAMHAGLNTLYGLPADDWQGYDAKIDAVTVEALRAFAVRYFQRSRRTQLVVKP